MLNEHNFTIVDLETTGGSPFFSRVIEIGILRVEHGEIVDEYQSLINPLTEIPEFITKMTGISELDVRTAPTFADVAEELLPKFEDSIFVAHNVNFDYQFLKEEFRRIGWQFNTDRLCTVRLSRALYKEYKHHNLSAIIERFEFDIKNRHRAFDDARVLWDFLQHIHSELDVNEVDKAMRQVLSKSRGGLKVKSYPKSNLIYEDES